MPIRPRSNADWCSRWLRTDEASAHSRDVERLVTIVIASLGQSRANNLLRNVRSVRRFYPLIKILVGDSGFGAAESPDAARLQRNAAAVSAMVTRVVRFQAGSATNGHVRNVLVAMVRTPYSLVMDDDFIFSARTKLESLLRVMQLGGVDVVAGMVHDAKCAAVSGGCVPRPAMLTPSEDGRWLFCAPPKLDRSLLQSDLDPRCFRTSWVRQFFLANTTALAGSGWDDRAGVDHFHGMWRLRLANARMLWCDGLCEVKHELGIRAPKAGSSFFNEDASLRMMERTVSANRIMHANTMWHTHGVLLNKQTHEQVCGATAAELRDVCPDLAHGLQRTPFMNNAAVRPDL